MGQIRFLIAFLGNTGPELLVADRIRADGRGHLIVYRGRDFFRCLDLSSISEFQIWPAHASIAGVVVH